MQTFSISEWNSWYPEENKEDFKVSHLSKNLSRRLSRMSKVILDLALSINEKPDFIVFASRHGAIHYSSDIIKQLESGQACSPIKFSQSVHNSIAGLYSIEKINAPVTAISAAQNSFEMGLLNSLMHLRDYEKILYLFSDPKIPQEYSEVFSEENEEVALAMLLKAGEDFELSNSKREATTTLKSIEFIDWMKSSEKKSHFNLNSYSIESLK